MRAYRDLSVVITGADGDEAALEVAVGLGHAFGAHVRCMTVEPPAGRRDDVWASGDGGQKRNAAVLGRLRMSLERRSVSCEVLPVPVAGVCDPAVTVAELARFSDITILSTGSACGPKRGAGCDYFGNLLLESGRPVLVVPSSGGPEWPIRRIAHAWKPMAASARALRDAIPLLGRAERVDVIAVVTTGSGANACCGVDDLKAHLRRHDVRAEIGIHRSERRPVADVIIERARDCGVQLVVAGGFGHPRQGSWAAGGVTYDLLRSNIIPVVFSH